MVCLTSPALLLVAAKGRRGHAAIWDRLPVREGRRRIKKKKEKHLIKKKGSQRFYSSIIREQSNKAKQSLFRLLPEQTAVWGCHGHPISFSILHSFSETSSVAMVYVLGHIMTYLCRSFRGFPSFSFPRLSRAGLWRARQY